MNHFLIWGFGIFDFWIRWFGFLIRDVYFGIQDIWFWDSGNLGFSEFGIWNFEIWICLCWIVACGILGPWMLILLDVGTLGCGSSFFHCCFYLFGISRGIVWWFFERRGQGHVGKNHAHLIRGHIIKATKKKKQILSETKPGPSKASLATQGTDVPWT